MSKWLRNLVILGVSLDFIISGYLVYANQENQRQNDQIQIIANKAACWDSVLDKAVTDHPTEASLKVDAQKCRALPLPMITQK